MSGWITAIERQKRKQRADVYLDGVCAFSLRLDVIFEARLAVGMTLTDDRQRELEAADQERGAIAAALQLLAMQPRSEKDLRDRLRRRAFRAEAIDKTVQRMRELGYLNDAAYARVYVDARQASTPRSRRALAFELGRKGVGREQAAEAVEAVSDEEAAFAAAERRLRALRGLDRATFTRRLGSFLASRGFSYGVARATIDRCWAAQAVDIRS